MSLFHIMEIAEALLQLDPVRTYPRRGAEAVAKCVHASRWRLEREGHETIGDGVGAASVSLPLRQGRTVLGVIHLHVDGRERLDDDETRVARWGVRVFARGLGFAERLGVEGGRRVDGDISDALDRAPLTRRERDVVSLLVSGKSTRQMAKATGLTVSTINTYLKRIFSKLGVHSRVELVARVAGTDAVAEVEAE